MSSFNSEQQSYMNYLASLPPETRCWCGWYKVGECYNCKRDGHEGKTRVDRLALACPECTADPPHHRIGCGNQGPWLWPLKAPKVEVPGEGHPGGFGTVRKHDIHTGVDLYCEVGTEVVAVEGGRIVGIERFTGAHADDPSPWWNNTYAVLVRGNSGVIVYGEVEARVTRIDQSVKAGEIIAVVTTPVLKRDKGRPTTMLHFEWMQPGAERTVWWKLNEKQPEMLRDPTKKLKEAT